MAVNFLFSTTLLCLDKEEEAVKRQGHDFSGPKEEDREVRQSGDTPQARGPEPKQSHQRSCEGGPDVMDALLDISSWLQATEAYIASRQDTKRVHCIGGATQPTSAKSSRRGSNLPATSPTQDAQERVTTCLRKVPILDMAITKEESGSDDAARE